MCIFGKKDARWPPNNAWFYSFVQQKLFNWKKNYTKKIVLKRKNNNRKLTIPSDAIHSLLGIQSDSYSLPSEGSK